MVESNDTFLVKGMHFRGKEVKDLVAGLPIGTIFDLEPDPENEYDPYAVKVNYESVHIGFVQAEVSAFVAAHLEEMGNEPVQCIVVGEELGAHNNVYPVCRVI